jgi:hypothetical protein
MNSKRHQINPNHIAQLLETCQVVAGNNQLFQAAKASEYIATDLHD